MPLLGSTLWVSPALCFLTTTGHAVFLQHTLLSQWPHCNLLTMQSPLWHHNCDLMGSESLDILGIIAIPCYYLCRGFSSFSFLWLVFQKNPSFDGFFLSPLFFCSVLFSVGFNLNSLEWLFLVNIFPRTEQLQEAGHFPVSSRCLSVEQHWESDSRKCVGTVFSPHTSVNSGASGRCYYQSTLPWSPSSWDQCPLFS